MEGDSTTAFDMVEYKYEGAAILAGVMPDYWEGHARILIYESDTVPKSSVETAFTKAVALAEKKDKTPKKAAKDLLRAIEEKR